jgi:hypothetical protein
MKKTLPVNFEIPYFFRGWESVRLPVILNNPKNYNWFIDKFNSLIMDTDFNVSYCFWDSLERLRIYDDILDYTRLSASDPKNLVETLIETINQNQYIIAVLDPSQMECSPHYGQNRGLIDTLVFGYDTEDDSFDLIDIEIKDLSQGFVKVSAKDFTAGFFSAYDFLRSFPFGDLDCDFRTIGFLMQNGPLSAYSVRETGFEPKLPNFYWELKKNLYGGEFTVPKIPDRKINFNDVTHIYFKAMDKRSIGVTIYKRYYETLKEMVMAEGPEVLGYPLVTWGVKSLSLIKSLLTDKLTYLNEKGLIRVEPVIIQENNELCKKIYNCFMMLTRYKLTKDLKYFHEFCDAMKIIEESDNQFLLILCRTLYDQINTNYLPDHKTNYEIHC